jgi:hypothetical protein
MIAPWTPALSSLILLFFQYAFFALIRSTHTLRGSRMLIGEKSKRRSRQMRQRRPDFGDAVRVELQLMETHLYTPCFVFL